MKLDEVTLLADTGYYKTADFKICEDNGITVIVAKQKDRETNRFNPKDFRYDRAKDVYICPNGAELRLFKPDENGFLRYRNAQACGECPLRERCTKSSCREIKRHSDRDCADRNDSRLAENPKLYKQRQAIVEHPFGTIKRTMGIRQFLTRGKRSVTAEVALIFLCYNLKRLRNIERDNGFMGSFSALFCFVISYDYETPELYVFSIKS